MRVLSEPVREVLGAVNRKREILLRIDLMEPVDRWCEQGRAGRGVFEKKCDIRLRMQTGSRFDLSVADFDPTTDALITRLDLRRQISLFETGSKMRISPSGEPEELHEPEQNDRELQLREHRRFPHHDRCTNDRHSMAIRPAR